MEECIKCDSYDKCLKTILDLDEEPNENNKCSNFNNLKWNVNNAVDALKKVKLGFKLKDKEARLLIYHLNKKYKDE